MKSLSGLVRSHPLASMLLLALIFRLVVFSAFLIHDPSLYFERDSHLYWRLGIQLSDEGRFGRVTPEGYVPESFRTPGYPFFLACVIRIFGENAIPVVLLQIGMGLFIVYLCWRWGREACLPAVGTVAAFFVALNPGLVYSNNLLLTETLYATVLLLAFYFLWRSSKTNPIIFAALGGLLTGLSVLIRPAGILIFPLGVLWLLFRLYRRPLHAVASILLFLLFYSLPVGGWMLRNREQIGKATLSTIGGLNLLESRAGMIHKLQSGDSIQVTRDKMYELLDERQGDRDWTQDQREQAAKEIAVEMVKEHPGLFMIGGIESTLRTYCGINMAFYHRIVHGREDIRPLSLWEKPIFAGWIFLQVLYSGLLYVLAAIAVFWLLWNRRWADFVLLGGASVYPAAILFSALTAHSRYLAPHVPFLAMLAGIGFAVFSFRFHRQGNLFTTLPQRSRAFVCLPVYNERDKLRKLLDGFTEGLVERIVVVDDGSTDNPAEVLQDYPVHVIRHEVNRGVGASIRDAIHYGRGEGFDVIVVMAGNGKDDPQEIPKVLAPLRKGEAVYVQGSRFLEEEHEENTPKFRLVAIRIYSAIFDFFSPHRCTDVTNGFRAFYLKLVDEPGIDIDQQWLERYEFEYYIHFKAFMLGYPVAEVPVHKYYPKSKKVSYSKIRPFVDWWKMIRPMLYLFLRIKR